MLVTITCDASHCSDYRVGGYGYWVVCSRGRTKGSGKLKEPVASSSVAEAMAVVNSIHRGIEMGLILEGDKLLIQTDCTIAIRNFEGVNGKLRESGKQVFEDYDNVVKKLNLDVRFKHVKAHTNNKGSRYWCNRFCDIRARKEMREARRAVKSAINIRKARFKRAHDSLKIFRRVCNEQ